MKQFIKENWFKVGMLMITIILVFVYLVRINQPATDNNETDIKISNEDLSFDINLNSLNYQLPKYDSICIPDKKYSCSKDDCKQVKAGVFVLIDYANNKFYRCDDKPCDQYLAKIEGIIPALESSHAIAYAMKLAPTLAKDKIIVINLSGRGDKDVYSVADYMGVNLKVE